MEGGIGRSRRSGTQTYITRFLITLLLSFLSFPSSSSPQVFSSKPPNGPSSPPSLPPLPPPKCSWG